VAGSGTCHLHVTSYQRVHEDRRACPAERSVRKEHDRPSRRALARLEAAAAAVRLRGRRAVALVDLDPLCASTLLPYSAHRTVRRVRRALADLCALIKRIVATSTKR